MKVCVVVGGPSTEAEVSRASGRAVEAALTEAGHQACCVELSAELPGRLLREAPEVVFPVAHGELGEDGCLQGLLELLELPYVGSGVRASALASDKVASKVHFEKAGLPLARQVVLSRSELDAREPERLRELLVSQVGEEFIVKPSNGGSTLGMSRVFRQTQTSEMLAGLREAAELDAQILVETYMRGWELTCGVLEGEEGPVALPPTRIRSQAADWYDFQSKYAQGGSQHECPAQLPEEWIHTIQAAAVCAHQALGARDLSRTDFIMSETGEWIVLELNNLPGMTKLSLFPEAAAVAGISFPQLVDRLVRRAQARPAVRPVRGEALPPST